jgi:outer membrane protein OmpA-like peptidoglycan-associated protein
MNVQIYRFRNLITVTVLSLALAACSTSPTKPEGSATARSKLTALQSDSQLASHAPVEIKDAEIAVVAAEQPTKDKALATHLVVMADRKVEIARAMAQSRLYEDQRKSLSEQSEAARLASRTREADRARRDADSSRRDADMARNQAEAARREATNARMDTEQARREADDLQQQIEELNARETDRGLVMTLGDVLFETNMSDLKGGSISNLGKLAAFLNRYENRTVLIEGHTDSIGDNDYNLSLSQRRADSVRSYLIGQGIGSNRLNASGMGEGSPVAGNDTATGRQQNRRVEIIISNTTVSSR